MSEGELDKLAVKIADLVFNALIEKQKEWDLQFTNDVNTMFSGNDLLHAS